MARTKQTARQSTGGKSCCRRRYVPLRPPSRTCTPTRRSIKDEKQQLKMGLCILHHESGTKNYENASHEGQSVFPAPFRFADLPLEIRRMIYSLTLTSESDFSFLPPDGDDVRNKFVAKLDSDFPSLPGLALLAVCKSIHAETLPILYGENVFAFHIGTRETAATYENWGPTPYNTALALTLHNRCALSLIRRVRLYVVTERVVDIERERGLHNVRYLLNAINQLAGWLSLGPCTGTNRLRELAVDFRHHVRVFYQLNRVTEPSFRLEVDERILDGLLRLRGVKQVVVHGDVTSAYRKSLIKQLTSINADDSGAPLSHGVRVGRYILRKRGDKN